MRNIIITADSNEGYTHSDRGTYLSMKYIDYFTSPWEQDIIRNSGKDKYGEALFVPEEDAGNVTSP